MINLRKQVCNIVILFYFSVTLNYFQNQDITKFYTYLMKINFVKKR